MLHPLRQECWLKSLASAWCACLRVTLRRRKRNHAAMQILYRCRPLSNADGSASGDFPTYFCRSRWSALRSLCPSFILGPERRVASRKERTFGFSSSRSAQNVDLRPRDVCRRLESRPRVAKDAAPKRTCPVSLSKSRDRFSLELSSSVRRSGLPASLSLFFGFPERSVGTQSLNSGLMARHGPGLAAWRLSLSSLQCVCVCV